MIRSFTLATLFGALACADDSYFKLEFTDSAESNKDIKVTVLTSQKRFSVNSGLQLYQKYAFIYELDALTRDKIVSGDILVSDISFEDKDTGVVNLQFNLDKNVA